MAHDRQPDFEPLPSFEGLVDEHQSMVYSLALRMTGDRGLAEEIAQDVFLELDRHMGRIESAAHACFWLRRVTMSRSADALRRRRVRGLDLWVEMEDADGAVAEHIGSNGSNGSMLRTGGLRTGGLSNGGLSTNALSARLEQLLATLPEAQRAALVLRYQEDLTPEEIAATLEAPLATVKSQLQRGLKLLRAKATTHLKEFVRGA
jgi:RNA polymerase sigma-70 factor (ECF subfamily)